MKLSVALLFLFLTLFTSCVVTEENAPQKRNTETREISFFTKDSIKVYGDLYERDKQAPLIILFHQARANARGEYSPIIPRLINNGYNVLAIDQRTGGQVFGSYNRTMAEIWLNRFGYCDAYPDFEAALQFAEDAGFSGKKAVWGSSYSAALVIKLAHQYPGKIDAVLAFSPASGGPMKECDPNPLLATLQTPLLVLRPASEMEIESVQQQFELAKENNHETHVAANGVHGSSMLVKERTGHSGKETWDAVFTFLSDNLK